MIVDAHMHVWDKVDGVVNGGVPVKPLGNGMIRIGDQAMLGMPASHLDCAARAEWVVAEFDAAGVDVGVVVQETMDGPQNDYLIEVRRKFSDRFFAHALPNWFEPDRVAAECAELFEQGFRGIKLAALRIAGIAPLDDQRFMPLYERMEAEGHVLAVDLAAGADQAAEMERILKRCPKLRVAIGHFGMVTRGDWMSQIRLCRHENVYVETGGIVWLFRAEGYPFRGAIDAIHQAKREVGTEKLMWGSDWPRTMVDFTYRQTLEFLRKEENGLGDAEKRMILGENAARLYQLPTPRETRHPVALVTDG